MLLCTVLAMLKITTTWWVIWLISVLQKQKGDLWKALFVQSHKIVGFVLIELIINAFSKCSVYYGPTYS